MVKFYIRPDGAHVRIDHENKIVTNVLNIDKSKVIAHFQDPAYVDNIISMTNVFTEIDEESYRNVIEETKQFLLNL